MAASSFHRVAIALTLLCISLRRWENKFQRTIAYSQSTRSDRLEEAEDGPQKLTASIQSSCFKPRIAPVSSSSLNGNNHLLPKPFINVGMPKMGSSSLQRFFCCSGKYSSTHWRCNNSNGQKCADCMDAAASSGKPLIQSCGNYDAYTQMDKGGDRFPQIDHLNAIHKEAPNATFLLAFRNTTAWYNSLSIWPPDKHIPSIRERLEMANISGLPPGKGSNEEELSDWFCNHVSNMRAFVEKHPSHALVEFEISDPTAGQWLGQLFGVDKSCWGHSNKNPLLHEGLKQRKEPYICNV